LQPLIVLLYVPAAVDAVTVVEQLTEPDTTEGVRMTVITDPQGATFTASKFVLENKDLSTQADPAVRAA
jgi:hypothetical protein